MMSPPTQIIAAVPTIIASTCRTYGMPLTQASSESSREGSDGTGRRPSRQRKSEVVRLHDQRDKPVNGRGNSESNHCQDSRSIDEAGFRNSSKSERHDLRRENEVGVDGARHLLVFNDARVERRGAQLGFVGMRPVRKRRLVNLLCAFVAQ